MIIRPVDENGDILPVLVSASLLRGAGAVARLVKDRLELLELDEPDDCYSDEYDDWEEERRKLEDAIEALEDEIDEMN